VCQIGSRIIDFQPVILFTCQTQEKDYSLSQESITFLLKHTFDIIPGKLQIDNFSQAFLSHRQQLNLQLITN